MVHSFYQRKFPDRQKFTSISEWKTRAEFLTDRQGVNLNLKLFLLLTTKLLSKVGMYHQNSYLELSVSLSLPKNNENVIYA